MKWVIGAFIFFALFIGTLSAICLRQDLGLVSPNYYQDELVHQNKMNQQQNMLALKEEPVILLEKERVSISFSSFANLEKGEIRLARPSNSKLDLRFELKNQTDQSFNLARSEKGLYRVSLKWSMHGKEYYYEKLMVL
jgi:nitrogen fixation protein FixH